jgi:hypothetical protein
MRIKSEDFNIDESRSNPMVVAMQYKHCPTNEICVYLAIGFGSVVKQCDFLKEIDENEVECTNDVTNKQY